MNNLYRASYKLFPVHLYYYFYTYKDATPAEVLTLRQIIPGLLFTFLIVECL